MTWIRAFVDRPIATILLTIAIIAAGIFGYQQLPVAALPQVDFPTIQISANLPGANPATMASAVATPIERQLSTVAGIDQITSSSSTGSTSITVQFALNRNIDAAALDVQSALSAVARKLPIEMTTPPSFQKVNPSDQSILVMALRDPTMRLSDLQTIADTTIIPRLSTLEGVAQIDVFGARKFAVRIQFDPTKLSARGLTPEDVRVAVAAANSNTAVGLIGNGPRNYILDATGTLKHAADFTPIVIAYKNGLPVRLGDIATSIDSIENLRGAAKFNGNPGLAMGIKRQPGANVVAMADRVEALLPSIRESLPANAHFDIIVDRSQSIRHSVADAQTTLVGTALLVVLVIYLVLGDLRATLIPAIVLPVAAIGTFAGMFLAGFSLDNLSLLALTLATGFVVDDAIVVLENIVRHVEHGEKPREAAVTGTKEIAFTVVSISVSLVAVFIPLLFMGGVIGRLFREFAVTMTIAIAVSAVIALTLAPMIASRVLREGDEKPGRIARWSTRNFDRAQRGYARALDWVLARRRIVLGLTLASIVVAIWGFGAIPKGFFPTEDTGNMFVGVEVAPDAAYPTLQAKQDMIAKIILADPAILRVNSFTGTGGGAGRIFAPMKPRSERDSAEVVQTRLRKALSGIPGVLASPNIPQNLTLGARPSSTNFQYTLQSVDQTALFAFGQAFEARMRATPGFEDVNSDLQRGARQARVIIDRDAASRLGVPVQAIRDTLYSSFGTRQISTIYTDVDSYQVILEIAANEQMTPDSINTLYVRGDTGATVPLSAVTRVVIEGAPLSINHQSQLPAVTISFNLTPGTALSQAKTRIDAAEAEMGMPSTIEGSFQGNAQAFEASTAGMGWLFLAAVLVIYIVLGVLYESFIHPITILSGLPAAGIGAVAALAIFHMPLDVIGIIGVVMLIGIVKKNAIMMIDFALAGQRAHGWTPAVAIRAAATTRFRPIMMTTFAAIAGALPLALGLGAGAELRQPLGVAVLGGLMVSQVLTLFITPVVYLSIESAGERRRARRLAAQPELPLDEPAVRLAAE
ncbi:efflux RND transporter permease subunit [Polymorphobacter sp. PAMC 29334]|uniref:efflux RND transporter permease subunit n=1 Tax=Polymorphobacter sp. PAMC 29334 TaxID=2862331 RepID=UPI001C770EFD|nr:efflux RND transporter permease subunit [Polymorphobacter sp. PAMC 29334]QYE35448.1 efflux RND transporter permease subunit [Polymorphobacter sp. PAMC 29334]